MPMQVAQYHSLAKRPSASIAEIMSQSSSLFCVSNYQFLFFMTASRFLNFSFSSRVSLPARASKAATLSFSLTLSLMISCTFLRLSSPLSNIMISSSKALSLSLPSSLSSYYKRRNSFPWPDDELASRRRSTLCSLGRGRGSLFCDFSDQKLLISYEYSRSLSSLPMRASTSWSCSQLTRSVRLLILSLKLPSTLLLEVSASSLCRWRDSQLAQSLSHLPCSQALLRSNYAFLVSNFYFSLFDYETSRRCATCNSPNCFCSLNISSSFS